MCFSQFLPSFFRIKKTRNLFEYQAPATKPHARKDTINVWSITSTLCIPHITSIHLLVYWSVIEDLESLYQPQNNALFLQLNPFEFIISFISWSPASSQKKKYDDASQTGVMINYQPKQCTILRGNPLTNLPSQAFLSNLISPKKNGLPISGIYPTIQKNNTRSNHSLHHCQPASCAPWMSLSKLSPTITSGETPVTLDMEKNVHVLKRPSKMGGILIEMQRNSFFCWGVTAEGWNSPREFLFMHNEDKNDKSRWRGGFRHWSSCKKRDMSHEKNLLSMILVV